MGVIAMSDINRRRAALLLMIGLLLLTVGASLAQADRTLTPGVPVTGVLDNTAIAQTYTFTGTAADTAVIASFNTLQVPLALIVTDAAGVTVGQGVDERAVGETTLTVTLPAEGTYYVTVFKAGGVRSVGSVTFSLRLDFETAGEAVTPEPTAAPEVTVEPGAALLTPPQMTEAAPTPQVSQLLTISGMSVTLSWSTTDDLDLEVRDPVGGSLYWTTPTVPSGGTLGPNANQGCQALNSTPAETASWTPGGIPTGSYEIIVYYEASCEGDNPVDFNVVVSVDGRVEPPIRGTVNPGDTFVTSFVINPDGTTVLSDRAGLAADQTLPAPPAELLAAAQPIAIGETVTGFIGSSRPYATYAFQATTDDLLTIDLSATSGSLDTFVALLDANGNIVRSNDDRARGDTNSLIADAIVPSAGVYTIVVTRYAKAIGGTEGDYTLSLTAQPSDLPEEFASLPRGSIEVRLLWRTNADLQLLVRDPAGSAVFDDVPEVRSGGRLAAQGNVNCRVSQGTPFSYIYWPQQIPPRPGSYEIEVWFQNQCGDPTPVSFNLYVSVNGQEIFSDVAQPLPGERYLTSFTVLPDGSVQPSLGGIIRGVADLDYSAELEAAPIITSGQTVTGAITPDNKFDVYVFQGTAGQVITLAMNATSGTLDTALYLIGPLNTVVAENDDAVVGENTNSLIANFTLPQDGRYIIIATHFGTLYGGTTGTYQLTLTQLN
jgi:hypothetical protein